MTTETHGQVATPSDAAGLPTEPTQAPPPPQQRRPSPPRKEKPTRPRKSTPMRGVVATTAVCALVAAAGQGTIWLAYAFQWQAQVPWQPVAGIVLAVVAIVAFGGYYRASRRARVAIAASFFLTFFVCLSYVLTLPPFVDAAQAKGARDLFTDFRNMVVVIIGFYFGSEAAISMTKILGIALSRRGETTDAIQRADRDYAQPEHPASGQQ